MLDLLQKGFFFWRLHEKTKEARELLRDVPEQERGGKKCNRKLLFRLTAPDQ